MARCRRRGRSQVPSETAQLGLARYSREAWERLREIADDRDKLDDTYEDWQRQALTMIQPRSRRPQDSESSNRHRSPRRLVPEANVSRIDMVARAEYVSYLLSHAEKPGETSR
jgi:hypothetical protein